MANQFIYTLFLCSLVALFIDVKARNCTIATHRVTGKNSLFSLICRCDGNPEMLGRSIRFLDPKKKDTIAQEKLTVGCIARQKPSMEQACSISGQRFEHRARVVLTQCMERTPKNPAPKDDRPFTFRREKCFAEFRELDVSRVEALLVCACEQPLGYLVHPGVIQFITNLSPNGATKEQKLLESCTKEFIPSLSQTCSTMPGRFDLRSAQKFNVCCKRLRTQFPKEKLLCQATVPDDVTSLDLTFVDPAL